jgi:hypothetical protein
MSAATQAKPLLNVTTSNSKTLIWVRCGLLFWLANTTTLII